MSCTAGGAPLPPPVVEFLVPVGDWHHVSSEQMYAGDAALCENGAVGAAPKPANYTTGCAVDGTDLLPQTYVSSLFGGRGRYDGRPFPLARYVVATGSTNRFRLVNAGFWFPLEISVDGHRLRIVASDAGELEPIDVDSFFVFLGERIEFELVANHSASGRYWMRARPQCVDDEARAVLVYDWAVNDQSDPVTEPRPCSANSPCTIFNCPYGRYPDGSNRTCISMGEAKYVM